MTIRLMLAALVLIGLSGCLSGEATMRKGGDATGPTINLPTPAPAGASTEDVRRITHDEIQASSNAISQNMGGMVDLAFGKAAEKIVGVEKAVGLEAGELNGIKATLTNNIAVTAKLADELHVTNTANVELKGKLELQSQIINDMKLAIGSMSAQVAAQVGVNNKTESTSVGHDFINYLPVSAVDMIISLAKLFAGITTALVGLLSTAIALAYRSAMLRERLRAQSEQEERQAAHQTLVDVLASLDPTKAKEIQEKITHVRTLHRPA
jgi:hypothetical protein